jgi:nucleoside-diphosphate-sugar epimerase
MNLRDVPVLVTGGSGFVGGSVAAWLAREGAKVTAIVRRAGAHPGLESPRITQVEGEFTDPATAQRVCAGQACVIHAAATVGKDLEEALAINARGTATLAAAARAAGGRHFVHISTVSVYDFQAPLEAFDEDAPLRELGRTYRHSPAASPHYGIAKAEGERLLWEEAKRGLNTTALRLGAVLGVHPTSVWVVKVPPKVRAGQVPLRGDGSDLMTMTHIDNVVHAVALALGNPRAFGRAYNVVDDEVTWKEFIDGIRTWFPDALPPPVIPAEQVTLADRFIAPCPSDRIRRELGYAPRKRFADGMREAGEWWRAQVRG